MKHLETNKERDITSPGFEGHLSARHGRTAVQLKTEKEREKKKRKKKNLLIKLLYSWIWVEINHGNNE